MDRDRNHLIEKFLQFHGWHDAFRNTLADDASFRRYERISDDKRFAVLMDAPPDKEDIETFMAVANDLKTLGCRVPEILAADPLDGFLLLEDLGNNTYTRILKKDPVRESELYSLAVDVLIHIQKQAQNTDYICKLDHYSIEKLLDEACIFLDWYCPQVLSEQVTIRQRGSYKDLWLNLLTSCNPAPQTIVLRDYHVDNLMLLDGQPGIAACGLLDFQDALFGSGIYDLMSLLQDARRDVDQGVQIRMKNKYFRHTRHKGANSETYASFEEVFSVLAANRHAKVLGVFTRLAVRDKKNDYLRHIPRVWRLLEEALKHPTLMSLERWFDEVLPKKKRNIPLKG